MQKAPGKDAAGMTRAETPHCVMANRQQKQVVVRVACSPQSEE